MPFDLIEKAKAGLATGEVQLDSDSPNGAKCSPCNGTGQQTKALSGGGVTSVTCPVCHGSGRG